MGEVGAQRFISQLIREPFDYAEWQENLFEGMSVKEISVTASMYCQENPRP